MLVAATLLDCETFPKLRLRLYCSVLGGARPRHRCKHRAEAAAMESRAVLGDTAGRSDTDKEYYPHYPAI